MGACNECLGYDDKDTFLDKAGNRYDKRKKELYNIILQLVIKLEIKQMI